MLGPDTAMLRRATRWLAAVSACTCGAALAAAATAAGRPADQVPSAPAAVATEKLAAPAPTTGRPTATPAQASAPALRDDPAALAVARRVEAHYARLSDLTADFRQSFVQKARPAPKVESGTLYVRRPRQVRWDYSAPRQKYFVFDGQAAWFYVVEDAQVIVDRAFGSNKLARALSFLWGEGQLVSTFTLSPCERVPPDLCAGDAAACDCIRLDPRQPIGELDHMYLLADRGDAHVHGLMLVDPIGNLTRLTLRAARVDSGLTAAWFTFTTPPGVTVLEGKAEQ